ncbi:unnamed protein product, partial [Mesorhabditis spiculigera]
MVYRLLPALLIAQVAQACLLGGGDGGCGCGSSAPAQQPCGGASGPLLPQSPSFLPALPPPPSPVYAAGPPQSPIVNEIAISVQAPAPPQIEGPIQFQNQSPVAAQPAQEQPARSYDEGRNEVEDEGPAAPPQQTPLPAPTEVQPQYDDAVAKRQANFELAQILEAQYDDLGGAGPSTPAGTEKTGEYGTIAKAVKKAVRMKVLRRAPLKKATLTELAEVVTPQVEAAKEKLTLQPNQAILETATTSFDPKCNSESLRRAILDNIQQSTAASKRKIQKAAVDAMGGRIDVICSMGTFSYIVNTELYCETERNGITCFAFRQAGN